MVGGARAVRFRILIRRHKSLFPDSQNKCEIYDLEIWALCIIRRCGRGQFITPRKKVRSVTPYLAAPKPSRRKAIDVVLELDNQARSDLLCLLPIRSLFLSSDCPLFHINDLSAIPFLHDILPLTPHSILIPVW